MFKRKTVTIDGVKFYGPAKKLQALQKQYNYLDSLLEVPDITSPEEANDYAEAAREDEYLCCEMAEVKKKAWAVSCHPAKKANPFLPDFASALDKNISPRKKARIHAKFKKSYELKLWMSRVGGYGYFLC